jgi:hypothetical protein
MKIIINRTILLIQVWDWSRPSPDYLYSVELMSPVTKVTWCSDSAWSKFLFFCNKFKNF